MCRLCEFFLIRWDKITDGRCVNYGRMRNILSLLRIETPRTLFIGFKKSSWWGISAFIRQVRDYMVWRRRVSFVLGPCFFEAITSIGMPTCSITGARYKTALQSYVILKLQQRNVINGIVWMQNDAPMLTATNVRQVLQQYFEKGNRRI